MTQQPRTYEYKRVLRDINAEIARGDIEPGNRIGSIRGLAERYGVSVNPVHRALKQLERRRIIRKADNGNRGGYLVAEGAAALATELQNSQGDVSNAGTMRGDVGLLFCGSPNLESQTAGWFTMPILHALQEELAGHLYRTVMCLIREQDVSPRNEYLWSMRPTLAGLVLTPGPWTRQAVEALVPLNVPLIWLTQNTLPSAKGLPLVQFELVSEDERAVAGGIRYLYGLGHRRIALIGTGTANAGERVSGYRRGLREVNLPRCPQQLERLLNFPDANTNIVAYRHTVARTMAELLDQRDPPTAVFCTNDITAFGVVDAIRERSLTLGVDVSVLGYDDLENEGYMPFDRPILTTLRRPRRELGQTAGRLLIEQQGSRREMGVHRIGLMPELIVRQSCGQARQ